MEQKPLSPKYDVVFKNIFSEKRIAVLKDFLQAVLDLPEDAYEDIQVMDPHLLRKQKKDKPGIPDLRISLRGGKKVDVEIQVEPQPSIWKRMLYYNAKLLTDQMGAGEDYGKINRVVGILISYPPLLPEKNSFHHRFRLYDEKAKLYYPDSPEIHILEVKKARDAEDSPLTRWLLFFAAETSEEFEMIAQTSPAIAEAWSVVKYLSADEEARMPAEYEEMARRDEADRRQGAYSQGRIDGVEEGRQEEKIEVACNLLREKMPVELVAKGTGLSLEEVERLAAGFSE